MAYPFRLERVRGQMRLAQPSRVTKATVSHTRLIISRNQKFMFSFTGSVGCYDVAAGIVVGLFRQQTQYGGDQCRDDTHDDSEFFSFHVLVDYGLTNVAKRAGRRCNMQAEAAA